MPSFRVNLQWASIAEVIPNLYISGVTALKPLELERLGINMIVNCTSEVPTLNLPGAHRIKLWLQDTEQEDIYAHLDSVTSQIRAVLADGGKVLVHCVAGVSRSAAIVLAYLTRYHCARLREAYDLMASKRAMVRPNLGFWRQLITYEQCVKFKPASVRLVWTRPTCADAQPSSADEDVTLLPDVYLPMIVDKPQRSPPSTPGVNDENRRSPFDQAIRERHASGKSLSKFVPVLSTLHEGGQHHSAPNLEELKEEQPSPRRSSDQSQAPKLRPIFTHEPKPVEKTVNEVEPMQTEAEKPKPIPSIPAELDLGFGATHSAVSGFVVVS